MQPPIKTPAAPTSSTADKQGTLILGLFGTPFALIGTALFVVGVRDTLRGKKDAFVGIIIGGIFMCVGWGIVYAAIALSRGGRRKSALQAQFPSEPWKWNKSWTTGQIADDSGKSALFLWLFGFLWNAISLPTFCLALIKGDAGHAIWLIAIFPLIGLGLISAAFYVTAQRYKYGASTLELETLPGRIGGWIAGTVRTSTVIDATSGVLITLKCVNRVTTSGGRNSSTSEYALWQTQQTLSGEFPRAGSGLGFPIAFQIPIECVPTRDDNHSAILWRLAVSISEPGIDYKSTFTVPVFVKDESSSTIPKAEALAARLRQPEAAMSHPHDGHISVEKDTAGRELIDFPPGRNVGSALLITLFALIFGGVGTGVMYGQGPWVIGIPFSLVGGLCAFGAATTLLKGRSIHVLQDAVELRWRMLGLGGTRTIPRRTISSINYQLNSSVGSTMYYQLIFTTTSGDIAAASGLVVDDVKWIAEELSKTLGISNAGETVNAIRPKMADRMNTQ